MKNRILALTLLLASPALAEVTVTLEGVHNCCKSCTNGITKAITSVNDVSASAEGQTVTITAKTKASAKKAVEALLAAGYYGKGAEPEKSSTSSSATSKKRNEVTVTGAHLCCQKCANAMADAVKSVPGVTEHTVASKANTFTVKGEFTEADLIAAMNKVGFHGSVK
ncbi:MAG: heavy-metal-associated domain-containing protein [Prosthecobacter sp.]|jgi:copper chaperone CopZ|nr:heavy-metal-associated domain-containing protein [Prosthecobacter sp.]